MSEESLDPAAPPPPPPPPNGGLKAWLQVLGAHFLFFNSWGLVNTFGVFQNFYEDSLLTTQSESNISWIGTFQAFLLVALSLFVGPFFDRGYIHLLIICGSFLIVFGMMMTSISENYWQVFLSQGLCVGIGTGLNFLPSLAIAATYFTTKRSLAIGIVASGGSIGSTIYPIVFERLEPRIGFPWTVRVMGFIALATLSISIATLRSRLPPPKQARAMLDPAALKDIPFVLFSVGMFLVFIGLYVPIFYIISWAQVHIHIERDLSFYMLSVLNGASVFGRIIPGLLADKLGAPLGLMVVNCAVAGILAFVAIAIHNLGGLVVFAILYGFVSGAVVSLPGTVLATLAPSLDRVGTWMGMALCFAALGLLIGNPIAGVIIHVPEDQFRGGFIFSGSFVLAAAAIFGLVLFLKRDTTKEEKR
ncbi:MFS general substrate transporter [Sarocladium strictum]